jgi:hypothetical protein
VETGQSKGSAYVKMGSYNAAKNAVAALDGLVSHVKFNQCVFIIDISSETLSFI